MALPVWFIILKFNVNNKLPDEETGTFAGDYELAVAANPTQPALYGPIALKNRRRVAEGASLAWNLLIYALQQHVQALFDSFVIIAALSVV